MLCFFCVRLYFGCFFYVFINIRTSHLKIRHKLLATQISMSVQHCAINWNAFLHDMMWLNYSFFALFSLFFRWNENFTYCFFFFWSEWIFAAICVQIEMQCKTLHWKSFPIAWNVSKQKISGRMRTTKVFEGEPTMCE